MSSRHLQQVFKTLQEFFKTSSRCIIKLDFSFLTCLQDVSKGFSRRTVKPLSTEIFAQAASLRILWSGYKFSKSELFECIKSFSKVFSKRFMKLHRRCSIGLNIPFQLTKILEMEFLEKNETTGTNLFILHFDQNFKHNS